MDDNEYHANDLGSVGFPYRLTGRTRINGLGNDGISMINTGRGRDLGAVVAAIDTRGVEDHPGIVYGGHRYSEFPNLQPSPSASNRPGMRCGRICSTARANRLNISEMLLPDIPVSFRK